MVSGSSVGAALTYPLCGFIIDRWGWELVFYVSGIVGTMWYTAWWILVYDSPAEHPRISLHEKEYITSSLGQSVAKNRVNIFKKIYSFNINELFPFPISGRSTMAENYNKS